MVTEGVGKLGLPCSREQADRIGGYINLLIKWNQTFNLIASCDPEYLFFRHVLDSLLAKPFIKEKRVLDVGSGGGLPGIPLAIMIPELDFTLLDSNSKKTRFLRQVSIELELSDRIKVVKSRIEEYRPAQPFDTVICRAFSSLEDFVKSCLHVCDQRTVMLAMKGRRPDAELNALGTDVKLVGLAAVTLPGSDVERHIVRLQKK